MTCPSCEYNKQRAAIWRAEAYKQAGHDVIQRPWIGLTDEDLRQIILAAVGVAEAKLKEKNT